MKRKTILLIILVVVIKLSIDFLFIYFISLGFNDKYDIITDINKYNEVINTEKWGMKEDIFPKSINNLNVVDFKYVYYNPWDANYLSYLVIDYEEDEYLKEIERLNQYGINDYIGYYEVTGFTKYKLISMNADSYNGFVYAITDEKNRIIYVELIFCNYYMDIDYEEQIPLDYLPDNFNAKIDNKYKENML